MRAVVGCAKVMCEACLQDWLQNVEGGGRGPSRYRIRGQIEITHVLNSFIFSWVCVWAARGVCESLNVCVHAWGQGARCNPIWFGAFCFNSWAHGTVLHVLASAMGSPGGRLEGGGKWKGLALDRGKNRKWSIEVLAPSGCGWYYARCLCLSKKGFLLKLCRHKPFKGRRRGVAGCLNSCCFAITDVFPVRSFNEEAWQMATKGAVQTRALLQNKRWALTVSLKCLKHM